MGQGFCPVFLDFLAYYGYNIDVNTWLIFYLSIGAPNPMLSFFMPKSSHFGTCACCVHSRLYRCTIHLLSFCDLLGSIPL